MVSIAVGQDQHLNVVYTLVLEMCNDSRAGRTWPAVYEDVRPVRSVKIDAVALPNVDEVNV